MNRLERCKDRTEVRALLRTLDDEFGAGDSRNKGRQLRSDEVQTGMLRTWSVPSGSGDQRVDAKVYGPDPNGEWEVLIYYPQELEGKACRKAEEDVPTPAASSDVMVVTDLCGSVRNIEC